MSGSRRPLPGAPLVQGTEWRGVIGSDTAVGKNPAEHVLVVHRASIHSQRAPSPEWPRWRPSVLPSGCRVALEPSRAPQDPACAGNTERTATAEGPRWTICRTARVADRGPQCTTPSGSHSGPTSRRDAAPPFRSGRRPGFPWAPYRSSNHRRMALGGRTRRHLTSITRPTSRPPDCVIVVTCTTH